MKTKIIAVFGPSGSGKTTYILDSIVKGLPLEEKKLHKVDVSTNGNLLLFGRYNTGDRCKGCDKLSMSVIDPLIECLQNIIEEQQYAIVVMDGDRVNNEKMFNFLRAHQENVEIIFINTPLNIIFQRLPDCNKQFVKTTFTKTQRTVAKCNAMGLKITHIKTERPKFFEVK